MIYPTGITVDYHRNTCTCIVVSITTTFGATTDTIMNNLAYRLFGGASAMNNGAGGIVGSQYDLAGKLTVANPGAEHEETYGYDNNGNLTSISSPSTPWRSRTYGYDAVNRLTYAEGPYGTIDYTYDNVGNRLTKISDTVTETPTYIPNTNKMDTVSNGASTVYTHDAKGNITGIGNKVLTYNQNNRLVMVEENNVILGEYIYNGLGQRIIKKAGGVTTIFHYDFDGNIIGESDASGNFTKEYLYRGSNRLVMVDAASGELYYYGNDQLGTPQILTDSTNTVVWEGVYKPFGEAEVNPNSIVVNNIRFMGQYYDEETGLHYNYFRYYDSGTGRYLTADHSHSKQANGYPIPYLFHKLLKNPQDLNVYVFVINNPINLQDPLGLSPLGCANAVYKVQKYCGSSYQETWDKASEYIDWCEKAWWYCIFKGSYVPKAAELPCDQRPTDDDCKRLNYSCPSDARKSCMNSPQFDKFEKQSAKCVMAIMGLRKCSGMF